MKKQTTLQGLGALALSLTLTGPATAGSIYFQGFETNTSGWYVASGGDNNGSITRVASDTGGITAADGNYYAQVGNSTNAYQAGYGTGGYTVFGSAPQTTPGSTFSQSIDIYIDPSTPAPTNPGVAAFWIDADPNPQDQTTGDSGGEHDFALFYNGTSAAVEADDGNGATLGTITSAGWYNFQFLYSASSPNPTGISNTTLNLSKVGGGLIGSTTLMNNSDGVTIENQDLTGPNFIWLPVWQNGFSNNLLAIDDVSADTAATPEPSTWLMLGTGLGGLTFFARRRRTAALFPPSSIPK